MEAVAVTEAQGPGGGGAACSSPGRAHSPAAAPTAAAQQQQRRRQLRRPVMLLIKGLPGTGKSTLANALARRLGWPLIDKDDARDCLEAPARALGVAARRLREALDRGEGRSQQDRPQPSEATTAATAAASDLASAAEQLDWNGLSYDIMFAYAERQLALGLPVIVDCPFSRQELFERARAIADAHGADIALVECRARDAAAWRARLEARGAADAATARAHRPATWAELEALRARYGGCEEWPRRLPPSELPHHLEIDTTAPGGAAADDWVDAVLERLVQWGLADDAAAAAAAAGRGGEDAGGGAVVGGSGGGGG